MYKLSEIVGKNVIGLYEAKNAGTIVGALLDRTGTKVRSFEVFSDEEGDTENKFFPPESVSAMNGDAVVIKNCGRLTGRNALPQSYVCCPISAPVYDHLGHALGRVTDLTIDGAEVVEINVGERAFPPAVVLARSEQMLIINDSGEKVRLFPPKPSPAENRSAAGEEKSTAVDKTNRAAGEEKSPKKGQNDDLYAENLTPYPQNGENYEAENKINSTENNVANNIANTAANNIANNAVNNVANPTANFSSGGPENNLNNPMNFNGSQNSSANLNTLANNPENNAAGGAKSGVDLPARLYGDNVSVTHAPAEDGAGKADRCAFLVGKTVTKNVYRDDGALLFSAGDVLTEQGVRTAEEANKLVHLALHSL